MKHMYVIVQFLNVYRRVLRETEILTESGALGLELFLLLGFWKK